MPRSQLRLIVDELAEDMRQYVFHTLDNEICIQGEEAGQVAAAIEHASRREIHILFNLDEGLVERGSRRHELAHGRQSIDRPEPARRNSPRRVD